MREFERLKAIFTKTVESLIVKKWITVVEYISHDGLATQFVNDLIDANRELDNQT
jgi:hypothetical protein